MAKSQQKRASVNARKIRFSVASMTILAGLILGACSASQSANHSYKPRVYMPRVTSGPADISARLILPNVEITLGRPLKGTLLIVNHTKAPITTHACGFSWLRVGLTDSSVKFAHTGDLSSCPGGPQVFWPGINMFPVILLVPSGGTFTTKVRLEGFSQTLNPAPPITVHVRVAL